ncbi:hypothetical protein FisN_11Hh200 [Fistulifera solaris]|uniref:Uncharacterized protein n=1 Tax=Fistulifera solaris TaxID=1519565 RepID=A0A1Z5JLK6_FISSO|nr:hypothetical protein FisN_11Hh200 [Fistulifera solaris]|eukprot:GAX14661.1 hypothetical protein FisN_11Hh200 [Fistulifera solaris]
MAKTFPRDRPSLKNKATIPSQQLFEPSIYTYTCRGSYFVSTTQPTDQREGTCKGLRSRLELLSDLDVNTRKGALEQFTVWAAGGDPSEAGFAETQEGVEMDPQAMSVVVSPALIFPDAMSKTVIDAAKKADKKKGKKHDAIIESADDSNTITSIDSSSRLPEEELIKRQDWGCYGSTQVDYLLLKNPETGEEAIAAVAPRNHGLSIREIRADQGVNISCYGIGWLSFIIDWKSDTEETATSNNPQPEANSAVEEMRHKSTADALASAKQSALYAANFTSKVGEHMVANVSWIIQACGADFPARTLATGKDILHEMPATIERTGKFMGRLVGRIVDDLFGDDGRRPR